MMHVFTKKKIPLSVQVIWLPEKDNMHQLVQYMHEAYIAIMRDYLSSENCVAFLKLYL